MAPETRHPPSALCDRIVPTYALVVRRALLSLLLWTACEEPPPYAGDHACEDATDRYGELVCVHVVPDREVWTQVTIPGELTGQLRSTKYLLPASEEALLPPLIVDSGTFELHSEMLAQAFPDQYGGFTQWDYSVAVLDPERRLFWSGNLDEYTEDSGGSWFGFTVWDDNRDSTLTVSRDQVLGVWQLLQPRFLIGDLRFVPNSAHQRDASATWDPLPFLIAGVDPDLRYEPYTEGEGYGTVRLLPISGLQAATDAASYGFQDLLILDDAPFDVPRPVSGVVTAGRQAALSHLNVRSAARGTPNCFIAEAMTQLASWEGLLVRLRCGADRWDIETASPEEAQAFWDELRPDPVEIPTPDTDWTTTVPLLLVPTADAPARAQALARFGAKGRNLATLYQRIDPALQLDGFVVPVAAYQDFVDSTRWQVDLGKGLADHSIAQTLTAWHHDPVFLSDGAERGRRLQALRTVMEDGVPPASWIVRVSEQIESTYGRDDVMVRVRSSSNAEDSLQFTGAGLYESRSVCLADDRDADLDGPSRCDPDQDNERGVARGLQQVWASLWTLRAWEERAWYGIDQGRVVMGILVDTRIANELANIVAFTGNPGAQDDRYLINAQAGDLEVVSSAMGLWPERTLLTLSNGQVSQIERVGSSSERPDGQVLSDSRLRELGAALWQIAQVFPQDDDPGPDVDVLLDTEWKIDGEGRLLIKQVRPFPRAR